MVGHSDDLVARKADARSNGVGVEKVRTTDARIIWVLSIVRGMISVRVSISDGTRGLWWRRLFDERVEDGMMQIDWQLGESNETHSMSAGAGDETTEAPEPGLRCQGLPSKLPLVFWLSLAPRQRLTVQCHLCTD